MEPRRQVDLDLRILPMLFIAALFLGPGLAQAAELVVFETHGTAFRSGQLIDGDSPIRLDDGQKVTLISMDGNVITLVGPFEGAPAPTLKRGEAGVLDALQGLVRDREMNTSALGVARRPDFGNAALRLAPVEPLALPGPWAVDVTSPGDWCYRTADGIELWHPEDRSIDRIDITSLTQKWKAVSEWPSGARTIPLPADMSIADNAKFWFTVDDKDALIVFRTVPDGLPTREAEAAWMVGKNCLHQARVLVGMID